MLQQAKKSWQIWVLLLVMLFGRSAAEAATELSVITNILGQMTNPLGAVIAGPPTSVRLANGIEATAVLFQQTTWELKNLPQSLLLSQRMEAEAMALPEPERLKRMDRFDDYTELWFVSLQKYPQAGAELKTAISVTAQPNRYYRELAFLGRGRGQAWYAFMPIYDWTSLQQQLRLEGGDDPLAAAARGVAVDDPGNRTRGSAEALLTAAGPKAIPYIKAILASTNFALGLSALGPMKGKEAAALLVETAQSPNEPLAMAARYVLESYPRVEAARLYLKWLEKDAGREPVYRLLDACEKTAPKQLAPYLPRILASPRSIYEFRRAFELSRAVAGKSIPQRLVKLEQEIKEFGCASSTNHNQAKVDRATSELLAAKDHEAVAVIGITLATAVTKGDWRPANDAGISILRELPAGYGRQTAQRVANSIPDQWIKEKLRAALN